MAVLKTKRGEAACSGARPRPRARAVGPGGRRRPHLSWQMGKGLPKPPSAGVGSGLTAAELPPTPGLALPEVHLLALGTLAVVAHRVLDMSDSPVPQLDTVAATLLKRFPVTLLSDPRRKSLWGLGTRSPVPAQLLCRTGLKHRAPCGGPGSWDPTGTGVVARAAGTQGHSFTITIFKVTFHFGDECLSCLLAVMQFFL